MDVEQEQVNKSSFSDQELNYSSEYSDNFPQILSALNISLAVTSYDSSCLMLIRSDGVKLNTQLEYFRRPMGLYVDQERLSLGTLNKVINFKRTDFFLPHIQNGHYDDVTDYSRKVIETQTEEVEQYLAKRNEKISELKMADALYSERATLTTGRINIHDIAWGNDRLWILNTAFSCLCYLDPDYNFISSWKPKFISELRPEDRCHLNGLAMFNGEPKYVTTCGQANIKDDWFYNELNGAVIDVETDEVLISGLYMPHSPKINGEYLYVCESGLGCIKRMHMVTKEVEHFADIPSFGRGLCFYGELIIVGLSKVRGSKNRTRMPIRDLVSEQDSICGVWILDVHTGQKIAEVNFTGDVGQIYDVAVVPDGHYAALTTSADVFNQHLFDFMEDE